MNQDSAGGARGWLFSIISGHRSTSALKERLGELFQDLTGQRGRLEFEKNDLLREKAADPYSALENLDRIRKIHSEMERIESSRSFLRALLEERNLSRARLVEEQRKLRDQLTELESRSRLLVESCRTRPPFGMAGDAQRLMRATGQRISSLRERDHLLRELLETDSAA